MPYKDAVGMMLMSGPLAMAFPPNLLFPEHYSLADKAPLPQKDDCIYHMFSIG